jgi:hypothetical protein
MQRELAHLAAAELVVGARAAFAQLEPEHGTSPACIPERSANEWRQPAFDLVLQRASMRRFR